VRRFGISIPPCSIHIPKVQNLYGIAGASFNEAETKMTEKECGVYLFLKAILDGNAVVAPKDQVPPGRVLAHEILHMLGMRHCLAVRCMMSGGPIEGRPSYSEMTHCKHMLHGLLGYNVPDNEKRADVIHVFGCSFPGTNGESWIPGHTLQPFNHLAYGGN
jgi:hypothetical protein